MAAVQGPAGGDRRAKSAAGGRSGLVLVMAVLLETVCCSTLAATMSPARFHLCDSHHVPGTPAWTRAPASETAVVARITGKW